MPGTPPPQLPTPPSPSPASPPTMSSLEVEDENVRIAIRALGDMKKGARSSSSSFTTNHANATSSSSPQQDVSPDFVSRVSNLPLVNTALRAYEQGKASSRVVKYGAEMMESSVKSISRPVIERLPVEQLDEFACRQLDKLERYRRPSSVDSERMQVDEYCLSSNDPLAASPNELQTGGSRTPTPRSQVPDALPDQNGQAVVQRSRWQAVLLEAGGIGAAVSEESMRRLKYCLQWLQYATTHIDAQIVILRDFIAALQPDGSAVSHSADSFVSPTHMRTLTDVRRDVVHTIRQVVDVVSKYAGGALPEPARVRVRGFILHLPKRWASASASVPHSQGIPDGAPGAKSAAGASTGGGVSTARRGRSTRHLRERSAGGPDRSLSATPESSRPASPITAQRVARSAPTSAVTRAAQQILTLATESLDMVRGVTGVVKESLDRADAWVERLRIVGLQRQQDPQDTQEQLEYPSSFSSLSGSMSASVSVGSSSLMDHRQSLPGLSSTPSTPAQASTPFSVPSTPAAYASPDGMARGIQLVEGPSLSDLRLDGDNEHDASGGGSQAPRTGAHGDGVYGKGKERAWPQASSSQYDSER
ncbi:transcription factor Opi1-domain-containing protein [Pisolithus croceorrhizus]|nr:transcription factor Opi1-domain-containing protein [Pisolithus croceorrhizus]